MKYQRSYTIVKHDQTRGMITVKQGKTFTLQSAITEYSIGMSWVNEFLTVKRSKAGYRMVYRLPNRPERETGYYAIYFISEKE